MPIKKSELYSSLWASCDELRGGMDASQYKDYVLVMLFVKYVSDKYAGQPYAPIVIPEGGGFADMVALKGDKEIGDKINKIIGKLAEANDLKGVIDVADFNDPDKLGRGKEMVDRLSNLVAIFENPALNFSRNRVEGDDILGDAYEYLMRHFATQSGKSKGQFYTPAEVSRVIAQVIGISGAKSQDQTIYDPTCGSGSLLLKAADKAPTGVTIYGQEMDNATAALARMNMILHGNPSADICQDNSLARPHWLTNNGHLKTFDFVVANPPFSNKAWRTGFDPENDLYGRFEYGIPPKKNGDYAFLLHILRSLKSTGKGAVVLPHGVLFRGNVEAEIRKNLVRRGYIKGIIGLPANLFYGTSIPACILVLGRDAKSCVSTTVSTVSTGIFMIDASAGYIKDGNKNRLRHQDIRKIVDVFNGQIELPKYSRLVGQAEIEANDYNLNIPRYIDGTEPEDLQDIAAHLRGGIPNHDIDDLTRYWNVFPTLKDDLFAVETQDFASLRVAAGEIKPAILAHPEFVAYTQAVDAVFAQWRAKHRPRLMGLAVDDRPQPLIEALSEDLLQAFSVSVETQDFASLPSLIDKYDVYQHLMTYWTETMQDDVYMIAAGGWLGANNLRLLEAQAKESADLKIGKLKYKADLIPPSIIVNRYFAAEQQAIETLEAEKDAISRQIEEMEEEHGGEDGLLEEAKNDKGNITKTNVKARLQEIKDNPDVEMQNFASEMQNLASLLNAYLALADQETQAGRAIREAQKGLDAQVAEKYAALTEDEIKTLVVDDKWLAALAAAVQVQTQNIASLFTGRVKELAERYAAPLPQIADEVEALSARVDAHLERMGFVWK